MSRLRGATYGVFCMVLLAQPLVLMRAERDVEIGRVSLVRRFKYALFHNDTISLDRMNKEKRSRKVRRALKLFPFHVIIKF